MQRTYKILLFVAEVQWLLSRGKHMYNWVPCWLSRFSAGITFSLERIIFKLWLLNLLERWDPHLVVFWVYSCLCLENSWTVTGENVCQASNQSCSCISKPLIPVLYFSGPYLNSLQKRKNKWSQSTENKIFCLQNKFNIGLEQLCSSQDTCLTCS